MSAQGASGAAQQNVAQSAQRAPQVQGILSLVPAGSQQRSALLTEAGEGEGGAVGGRAARQRRVGTDVSYRTLLGATVTAVRRPRGRSLDSSGDEKDAIRRGWRLRSR